MLIYIIYVNKASTFGYFHKEETEKLDTIMFDYNLVKLDVLDYEQKLRQKANNFDAWSDPKALRDRLIVIQATDLSQSLAELHNQEPLDQTPVEVQ